MLLPSAKVYLKKMFCCFRYISPIITVYLKAKVYLKNMILLFLVYRQSFLPEKYTPMRYLLQ